MVWIEGSHAYNGRGRYVWVNGAWATPPGRYRAYVAPYRMRRDRGYVYVEGCWR